MKVTEDNIDSFGIGHLAAGSVSVRDMDRIVYGPDFNKQFVTQDPTTPDGDTPYWREHARDIWWKMVPRSTEGA